MTIASSTRKAGPFTGDDASTVFAFSFKVFSAADLYVVKAVAATGAETVLTLTTDYTVSLNADQNNSPGGTVTLTSVLASGYTLTLTSSVGYLQPTDLTNQGGFYPQVITTALDRLTILAQQLKERLDRAAVLPISSTLTVDDLTADLITLADDVANIDTVASNIADIGTVAGISTDVSTAADNITSISNFADIYYGPSATEPTTRKDGSTLQEGDLYFDTVTNLMRVRTAVSGWVDAQTPEPVTITTQTFSGTGSRTVFTLSSAPAFLTALEVAISGAVKVPTTDYTLSGTTLTFASAPASGTNNIFCRWYSAYSGGVPNDGSVTAAKLSDGMVVQIVEATPFTTHASASSVIPHDDTIPQITEGASLLTASITPHSASNKLLVFATASIYSTINGPFAVAALFKNSTANAISAASYSYGHQYATLAYEGSAGTTSSITFSLRIGTSDATFPIHINGNGSGRLLGGTEAARMVIVEVKA